MLDADNNAVITLGCATDHGGVVKTAFSTLRFKSRPVAGEDDLTWCPRCKGDFRILASPSGRRHMGRTIAYEGTLTECGARLIAALVS